VQFWDAQRATIDLVGLTTKLERDGTHAPTLDWSTAAVELERVYIAHLGPVAKSTALQLLPESPQQFASESLMSELEFKLRFFTAEEFLATTQFSQLMTTLTSAEIETIRRILLKSFRDGIPPYDTASLVRDAIGMMPSHWEALQRYGANLDPGLSGARRDQLYRRYKSRLERYHAETIARTETIRAANTGQYRLWKEAQNLGLLPRGDRVSRKWIMTPDDRACAYCQSMKGQLTTIDEGWHLGTRLIVIPPLHPRCRCAQGLVFDAVL
jgi:hypothetical protein